MPRVRVSTTVDGELLDSARAYREGLKDAELLDEALGMLVAEYRRAEIDRKIIEGYTKHPVDEPDEWGVLPDFIDAMREANERMMAADVEAEEWD